MNNELTLWVDDLRNPFKIKGLNLDQGSTIWVLDFYQAVSMLGKINDFTIIHLDNDLGENTPEGRDVLNHIEFLLFEGKLDKLHTIFIHSDNSSAVRYMLSAKEIMKEKYGITMEQKIISKKQYS